MQVPDGEPAAGPWRVRRIDDVLRARGSAPTWSWPAPDLPHDPAVELVVADRSSPPPAPRHRADRGRVVAVPPGVRRTEAPPGR